MRSYRPTLTAAACLLALLAAAPAGARVLQYVELQRNLVNDVQGLNGPDGLAISPDGANVYVAAGSNDAVAVFRRDPITQTLSFVEAKQNGVGDVAGLGDARGVAVSPDGRNVYVASHLDDALVTFARDAGTGALTFVQVLRDGVAKINGLDGASGIAISPDGAHLYVAGEDDDSVSLFTRDSATGALAFVEMQRDRVAGVDGVQGARAVVASADGRHVYVAGSLEDAIALFDRDPATGHLTYVATVRENEGGVTGLGRVRALALSPDGDSLYAAGFAGDAIVAFTRDLDSGRLSFVQVVQDGVDGVNGLNGASGIAIAADGRRLYVTGVVDNALAVFRRDPATGLLTFDEMHRDSLRGIDGLDNAQDVVVSPDGRGIYATGHADDAVAVFRAGCGDGVVDPGEQCDDGNDLDGDCCSSSCRFEAADQPCTDDANVCTDDLCNATGVCEHRPNTAPCDDGLFCTAPDVCKDGTCQGAPRDCAEVADGCNDARCDEGAATCVPVPKPDETACTDGNACTTVDSCVAGRCVGTSPVVCPAGDQCHAAGVCDPASGVCAWPAKPNGTTCNDGVACTHDDACVAGVCGGIPVVCGADACHEAGSCDESTGQCVKPTKRDGTACDDGDVCTTRDACRAGKCTGTALPDQDHDGVCDPIDDCPDIADTTQGDANHDGVGDACQCASLAPGHCIPGGGDKRTDCLVEFNPAGPVELTPDVRGVKAILRCTDGDPKCDRDGVADGKCTFGVAICVANRDPRLPGCKPATLRKIALTGPALDAKTPLTRTNAAALARALGTLGFSGAQVLTTTPSSTRAGCSAVASLAVPAPGANKKPVRRILRLRGEASDGHRDADRLVLECR